MAITALAALAAACGGGSATTTPAPDGSTAEPGAVAGEGAPTVLATSLELASGEEGDVQIEVAGFPAPGLGAWTVDIEYDPAVVSVVECEATLQLGVCNAAFSERSVRVTGATAQAPEGDSTVARFRFRCEAAGESALTISVDTLADGTVGEPQDVAANTENGAITCS